MAPCRCGASAEKPFCYGCYAKLGFRDAGRYAKPPEADAHASDGEMALNPVPNGPLRIDGFFELVTADCACRLCGEKTWLCRCRHSGIKPLFDGTHKRIGFTTP